MQEKMSFHLSVMHHVALCTADKTDPGLLILAKTPGTYLSSYRTEGTPHVFVFCEDRSGEWGDTGSEAGETFQSLTSSDSHCLRRSV